MALVSIVLLLNIIITRYTLVNVLIRVRISML